MSDIKKFHKVDILHSRTSPYAPDAILLDGFVIKGVQSLKVDMDTGNAHHPTITIVIIPRELHEVVEKPEDE